MTPRSTLTPRDGGTSCSWMSETESVYEKARRELEEEGWNCETCANWRKHE
jgi:hypothetical protein